MDQIVVKTEVQPNGEILLYYVDESDPNAEGVITSIESINQGHVEFQEATEEEPLEAQEITEDEIWSEETDQQDNVNVLPTSRPWLYDEINRLLTFYIDNKQTFKSGVTKKKDLWNIACKTMLPGRNITQCEMKLRNIKRKYAEMRMDRLKGIPCNWPHYDICHQAFYDDSFVLLYLDKSIGKKVTSVPIAETAENDAKVIVVKESNTKPKTTTTDEKVELMLFLYLKYKNNQKVYWQKGLWETIALQIGEEDGEYWHKRFLNFKQHYIRLLDKRAECGAKSVSWPYMNLFDQIFAGDEDFQRKFMPKKNILNTVPVENEITKENHVWNQTEITVLGKYYFECFYEFRDPTIPNQFLWNEIGRLLDKPADDCKEKYNQLKNEHINQYLECVVDLRSRIPIQILFDNIIAKEVEIELAKKMNLESETWKTEEIDELAQFIYDNVEMFKDSVCYYVCWEILARKLKRSIHSCRRQWKELTILYKSILDDKKENPDMQIDWRYIELFDRIFDYGMDTNMLEGYDEINKTADKHTGSTNDASDNSNDEYDMFTEDESDEEFDNNGRLRRSKRIRTGDSKAFKILDFYLKNKDKFAQRKKLVIWEVLGKQIGLSASQCAHRFRNLKQVYKGYVQREINKPLMPIIWPYYALCKKVFGYRALKSKLKNNSNIDSDKEDWSPKEIKQLINYFEQNFSIISNNDSDVDKWADLARTIGKSSDAVAEKFAEIRRSYRRLKAMKTRKSDVKVTWKYYNMIDAIYSAHESVETPVENVESMEVYDTEMHVETIDEMQEDEDYEYIIVLPEGQDIENAEITISENTTTENQTKPLNKWNKFSKKKLLLHYLKYLRAHKGQEINRKNMWNEISSNLMNKTPLSCRKMFAKLKKNHMTNDGETKDSPYSALMKKIIAFKPKFDTNVKKKELTDNKIFKNVDLPDDKIEKALLYYLQHIEDFNSPKYEKKYLWTELANFVEEPVTKVFNKINYLKQLNDENTIFSSLIQEILVTENALNANENNEENTTSEELEQNWTDDEIEQLLIWYLGHLDKFKNPKFVRKYLWMDVSAILKKSPLSCSKKMAEIRTQYRTMVKEESSELNVWRFHDLCQKIYGTGKKNIHETMQSDIN